MLHKIRCALLVCVGLTSCASISTADDSAPQGPAPNYKAIVSRYLRADPRAPKAPEVVSAGVGTFFRAPQNFGLIELSQVSLVRHNTLGWTWLTCLRSHPAGKPPSDYTIFIKDDAIVDVRRSIETDNCATQSYETLGTFAAPRNRADESSSKHAAK
jgi:hypothetical protein